MEKRNGMGTAGFVLGLIGLILCWVPFLNIVLLFLGTLFSFIGLFKSPRGLAIAGLITSLFGFLMCLLILLGILVLSA